MTKSKSVFGEVKTLYQAAPTSMGTFMWRNHTQWVANKAKSLAEKYGANTEKVYCAALLHDLADCQHERGHENFDTWSKHKGREILQKAGFSETEIAELGYALNTTKIP
jgi:putative nucleotidyltransferase with HDIG domain